jgi:hypothetical protein
MAAPILAAAAGSAVSNQQQPAITIQNGNSSGGLPWYGWLIIAAVVVLAFVFILPFVIEKVSDIIGIAKESLWNAALATPLGGILGFFFPSKASNSNSYSARQGAKARTVTKASSRFLQSRNPLLRFSFLRFLD